MVFRSCFSSLIIRSYIFYANKRTNTLPMDIFFCVALIRDNPTYSLFRSSMSMVFLCAILVSCRRIVTMPSFFKSLDIYL